MFSAWRMRTFGVCAFALIAGLLAAWSVHEHIETRERELQRQTEVETWPRLVIAADLVAGVRVQVDHLAVREVPLPWVPGDSFEPQAVDRVLGRMLTVDLKQGDILLGTHLVSDTDSAISDRVSSGRRAVTLPVSEINVVSGLLQVEDLIDLYVSFDHDGQRLTAPLLQGVRVLALDERDEASASITLDASQQDAVKLVAARHAGSLTAMLRHHGDAKVSEVVAPGDLAALMGLTPPPTAARVVVPILYGDRVDEAPPAAATSGDGTPSELPGEAIRREQSFALLPEPR